MTDYLKSQWMMITHHHHLPPYIWTKRLKPGGPPDKPQQEQLFIKQGQHTAFPCARLHPKAKWRPLKRIPPQDNALVRLCGGPSSTPHHSRRPFQAQEQLLKNHHALANGRQMIKMVHNVKTLGVDDNCVLVESRTSGVDLLGPPADPRRPTLASFTPRLVHSFSECWLPFKSFPTSR